MTWKPIETAPKDGTHVLLFRPEINFVGYWSGTRRAWIASTHSYPAGPAPTHWMPLPPDPEVKR